MNKPSYRPISNLNSVEKVFEGDIKEELEEYFYSNNIIVDNHHGGRPNRSTITAKAKIDAKMAENYEDDMITTVISTDLSKAFETIDHVTLIQKMEFYGIKDGEKKFFESFLSERMQFV